jgi:integrase
MTAENLHIPQNARVTEKKALRIDEIKTLFTSDKVWLNGKEVVDWYIYAYRTYVLIGLRPGELAGLELSDILPDRIRISRSIIRIINYQGKNKNARRAILLPDIQKQYSPIR